MQSSLKVSFLTVGVVGLCGFLTVGAFSADTWNYDPGDLGPGTGAWAAISTICASGTSQSPIDIVTGTVTSSKLDKIKPKYKKVAPNVTNNGHTVQATWESGKGSVSVGGETYNLLQFHFHTPSEHTVDGKAAPMEIHFVHSNGGTGDAERLVVIGAMMVVGDKANSEFQKVLENEAVEFQTPAPAPPKGPSYLKPINAKKLLPKTVGKRYWTYEGSLTTPPCTEIVTWIVAKDPIEISPAQLRHFQLIIGEFGNARPVQDLGSRTIQGTDK